jgi:hypothetical protein
VKLHETHPGTRSIKFFPFCRASRETRLWRLWRTWTQRNQVFEWTVGPKKQPDLARALATFCAAMATAPALNSGQWHTSGSARPEALGSPSLPSGRSPRTPRGPRPESDSELGGDAGLRVVMLVLAIPVRVAVVARGTVLMPLRRLGGSRA